MDSFTEITRLLPPHLRERADSLPSMVRRRAQELRLRAGRVPAVTVERAELPLPGEGAVTRRDLELILERATQASAHTALERVRQGWFTVRGGHRIGLCGSLWSENGLVRNLRCLSSLNIRVAHAVPGCGEALLPQLCPEGRFGGALILSPPGFGKTTLLRDLVRLLAGHQRVGLCDERGEVAALWEGIPQMDVGERTDVLEGCPKAQGLLMLLRGMNPGILCCDEITDPHDLTALSTCANCGVKLLATAHAAGTSDLWSKPLYRELLAGGLFPRVVVIGPDWTYRVEELGCGS